MINIKTRWTIFLILSALMCPAAIAQDEPLPEASYAADRDPQSLTAIEYWTSDRIARAKPFPLPKLSESDFLKLYNDEAAPYDDSNAQIITDPADITASYGNPVRPNIRAFPYRIVGKLFFTIGETDYQCSGSYVAEDVILTAAHCVRDNDGTWAKNIIFRRAYDNGGGQSVRHICLATHGGWVSNNSTRYNWDYAFIKTIDSSTAGYLGIRKGLPNYSFESIGYPRNFGSGEYMQKVLGRIGNVSGRIMEMLDNPMSSGSSGGPWVHGKHAFSVNSFEYETRPDRTYGPVFGDNAENLFRFAQRGCPKQ